jgi:hypothetical protein
MPVRVLNLGGRWVDGYEWLASSFHPPGEEPRYSTGG